MRRVMYENDVAGWDWEVNERVGKKDREGKRNEKEKSRILYLNRGGWKEIQ